MGTYKYECDQCGSVLYIEAEVWESCPICEETPIERDLRERAIKAEQDRFEFRVALKHIASGMAKDALGSYAMSKEEMQQVAREALQEGGE